MINEGLIKLGSTQQLRLYFDFDLMMLEIFCEEFIVISEKTVNFIYCDLLSGWHENITGLILRILSRIHAHLILL